MDRRKAEVIGTGLYLLVGLVLVGRSIASNVFEVAAARSSAIPSVAAATVTASPSAIATSAPSTESSVRPAPSPSRTPDPGTVTAYESGGKRFAALALPIGHTLSSPIAGRVSVVVYQFLAGDIRVGSNVPSEPFFPYVTIASADRRVILRPGALNADVQLLVKDGESVAGGTALFRIVGSGPSSWRTFYDRSVTAQVIASVAALPSGAEVDPLPLFGR